MMQNFPNPFNPETTIQYQLPQKTNVRIIIYNLSGQKVITLIDENQQAGLHSAYWHGKDQTDKNVPSGIYLYILEAEGYIQSRRLILIR